MNKNKSIDSLVNDYDDGVIDRRQFVLALSAFMGAPGAPQEQRDTPFRANSLNHVTLAVTDPERSREFYESVLGIDVVSRQSNGINLGLGDSFLGLYQIPNPGHIHHFCVGVDDYEIQEAAVKLSGAGIEPFVRQDRPEIYFSDPDGIRVQLSEKDYRG